MDTKQFLYAFQLGGRAPKCRTELHDIVFATGPNLKSTYPQLVTAWFGSPEKTHIDTWTKVDHVDGYKVSLKTTPPNTNTQKLFFINLGAYKKNFFGELHFFKILVGSEISEVKARAKKMVTDNIKGPKESSCEIGSVYMLHTDDLIEVDSIEEIKRVQNFYIHLEKDDEIKDLVLNNDYLPFLKEL